MVSERVIVAGVILKANNKEPKSIQITSKFTSRKLEKEKKTFSNYNF